MTQLYYQAPSDEQFNEVKSAALSLWKEMGDEESYRKEKIGRIKDLKNISDNFMYMIAMFDSGNQRKLAKMLSKETRLAVRDRMIDGGSPEWLIVF